MMMKLPVPLLTSYWPRRLIVCIIAMIALPLLSARASPEGAMIRVNTTNDELNTNGNCSLREAIRAANLNTAVDQCPAGNGADEIKLPAGSYVLSIAGDDENEDLTGDLDITEDVRLLGSGPDATIVDGNSIDRVFHIIGAAVRVELYHLTIQKGYASSTGLDGGGGVYNNGILTITGCVIRDNQTPRIGGGVDNTGALIITNSTFHHNSALDGGGVFNGGTATLNNVTFYENTGEQTGGAFDNWLTAGLTNVTFSGNTSPSGGGIFNDGDLALLNCTITGNTSGIANRGTARSKSTMIVDSTSGDGNNCTDSNVTSEGNNLDSGSSCNFADVTDMSNTAPQLSPLGDNGGPTWTHGLLPGSPAIDKGSELDCPRYDQRGAFRPADGDENGTATCDIGSVEFNGMFPNFVYLPIIQR
jgi:CSLREA domain-containing protein